MYVANNAAGYHIRGSRDNNIRAGYTRGHYLGYSLMGPRVINLEFVDMMTVFIEWLMLIIVILSLCIAICIPVTLPNLKKCVLFLILYGQYLTLAVVHN